MEIDRSEIGVSALRLVRPRSILILAGTVLITVLPDGLRCFCHRYRLHLIFYVRTSIVARFAVSIGEKHFANESPTRGRPVTARSRSLRLNPPEVSVRPLHVLRSL